MNRSRPGTWLAVLLTIALGGSHALWLQPVSTTGGEGERLFDDSEQQNPSAALTRSITDNRTPSNKNQMNRTQSVLPLARSRALSYARPPSFLNRRSVPPILRI